MKKVLLMLLAGFMALGVSFKANASARIDSMSTDVREVEDIDLIWLYPNKALEYKNTVDFRLNAAGGAFGNGTGEWGGVISDESSSLGGVLGVYVNRPNDFAYYNNSNDDVDIFFASGMGDGSFGLRLLYSDNGITQPDLQEALAGLELGVGFVNVGPFGQLNVHLGYAMQTVTEVPPVPASSVTNKDNGIYMVTLGVLGQSDLSDTSFVRTFLDLAMSQYNMTDLSAGVTDWSDFNGQLGVALSHKVNSGKGLVNTGLILGFDNGSNKATNVTPSVTYNKDNWNIKWNGSVESQVADWLTLRAGIQKVLVSRLYESFATPTYTNDALAGVSFKTGFGINWQNFTLNGLVTAESLENSINSVQPGNGLLFTNNPAPNTGIVTVSEADLSYKF